MNNSKRSKRKQYNRRLLGYSIAMVGFDRMNDVFDYYHPEYNNINYWFMTAIIGLFVGFWILIAFSE